jgi:muramidase (phage lysozyme)
LEAEDLMATMMGSRSLASAPIPPPVPDTPTILTGGGALATPVSPPLPITTGPVSTDLPPHAKTFLDTIAGPESTKQYDVRYAPGRKGEAPFTEGPEHPNVPEPTAGGKTSTAAGRYQITKETWDEYTRRYPTLTEGGFTRENQDKVAWQLALNRYKSKTGRDLGEDLKSGRTGGVEPALIATWTGGAKGFAKRFASQSKPILLASDNSERGI